MKKKIIDLIDFERIDVLLEGFNKSTGFVTAILDLDGKVRSKSGWRSICTDFHRINPNTSKKCTISDTELAGHLQKGKKYHFYKCLNGLIDVAVPIVIHNEHIGNLFSGQFFFEEPDRNFFIEQARKYNFNNEAYLKALNEVPVMNEERVKPVMDFLLNMTELIAEMTMQRIEQKQLNDTLKESEEKFSSVFNNSPTAYTLFANSGKLIDVNPAFCKMTGYSHDEVIGKTATELNLIREEDQNRIQEIIAQQGVLNDYELDMLRKDGGISTVELSIKNIDIDQIQYNLGIANDISDRKQAEKELRNSKEFTESLIQTANVIVIGLNTAGDIHIFNKAAEDITGYSIADLKGKNWFEALVPKSCYPAVWEEFEALTIGGEIPKTFENPIQTKSGQERFISWQNGILKEGDTVSGTISFGIDVTERKQAEEKMRYHEQLLTEMGQVAKIGGWEFDAQTGKGTWTEEVAKIHDLDPKDTTSMKRGLSFYKNEHKAKIELAIKEAIELAKPYNIELEMISAKGIPKWVQTIGHPVVENGNVVRVRGSYQDITDRKQSEIELKVNKEQLEIQNEELMIAMAKAEESERLKTAFLQNMSHEIRTPLNSIVGFSELITDPEIDQDRKDYFYNLISQGSNQLLAIITDIVNISTFDAGQEKINDGETIINELCRTIEEQLFLSANKKRLKLTCKTTLSDEESVILTDETKLTQALNNLIGNALKFTSEGYVEFGYVLKEKVLEFYVQDTGIGILKEKMGNIFDRFHQLDNASTRKYGGSGLGLSISKAYIELLGGKMWVESEFGKGSTFYFTVPYRKV